MVLSIQKVEGPRSRFSSFRSNAFCLAAKVAACNSSRDSEFLDRSESGFSHNYGTIYAAIRSDHS